MAFASTFALFLVSVSSSMLRRHIGQQIDVHLPLPQAFAWYTRRRRRKPRKLGVSPPIASCTCSLMLFSSRPGSPSQSHTGEDNFASANTSFASARNLRRAKKLPGLFPSSDSDSLCPRRAIFCFPQNTIQEITLRSSFLFFAICLAASLSMIEVIDVSGLSAVWRKSSALSDAVIWYSFFWWSLRISVTLFQFFIGTSQERLSWYLTLSAQTKHNTYNIHHLQTRCAPGKGRSLAKTPGTTSSCCFVWSLGIHSYHLV